MRLTTTSDMPSCHMELKKTPYFATAIWPPNEPLVTPKKNSIAYQVDIQHHQKKDLNGKRLWIKKMMTTNFGSLNVEFANAGMEASLNFGMSGYGMYTNVMVMDVIMFVFVLVKVPSMIGRC